MLPRPARCRCAQSHVQARECNGPLPGRCSAPGPLHNEGVSPDQHPTSAARQRRLLALAGLAWLAGCGSAPKPAPPPPPPPAAPVQPPPPPPPPAVAPAPAPAAPPRIEPVADVQAAVRQVQGLLQDGDAEAAEALCRRILATDPAQPQALSLLRQIETDPVQIFGRESHLHVVRPGESLSSIARDRLRDANLF
jgi:hypothetical protein